MFIVVDQRNEEPVLIGPFETADTAFRWGCINCGGVNENWYYEILTAPDLSKL